MKLICPFISKFDTSISSILQIPQSLSNSRLYRYLQERNILYELDFNYQHFTDDEKIEMMDLFGSSFDENYADRVLGAFHNGFGEFNNDNTIAKDDVNHLLGRKRFIDQVIRLKHLDIDRYNNDTLKEVYDLASRDVRYCTESWRPNHPDGYNESSELTGHFLRTAGYWEIAGKLRLAFLPDFMRIPILAGYNARIKQSLRMFIGAKVDQYVRQELNAALSISESSIIPIPNSALNYLEKFSKTSSMEEAFDDMRKEFSEGRKAIMGWEKKMRRTDKSSYNEAQHIMKEISSSLNAMDTSDKSDMITSASPGVVSDVLGIALSGTPGLSSVEFAIKTGIDLIVTWRRRSRISYFNTGNQQGKRIENHDELLKKAFGNSLTPT